MGFSISNFMAGVGQGIADAGLESMKATVEQQRMAKLNEYNSQLEQQRSASAMALQANNQSFTAGQNDLNRSNQQAMNNADNASQEKRTGMMTGIDAEKNRISRDKLQIDRDELEIKKPVFEAQAEQARATADYHRTKGELERGKLEWKAKWEQAKTPEEKNDIEREWTLWNQRKQLEVQKAAKGYQFGTIEDDAGKHLYRGNKDTGQVEYPKMPKSKADDTKTEGNPSSGKDWRSIGGW